MDASELIKIREEIDRTRESLNEAMSDAQDRIGQLETLLERLDKEERNLSKEEFDQWIAIGMKVGAEVEIDNITLPPPCRITGICCDGFILTDGNGREYRIEGRYLKIIDRFHVKPEAQK